MKNLIVLTITTLFLSISGCTKTEEPATTMHDSCQMQIDSLKAEIAALKKPRVRHTSMRLHASKFFIDTTKIQQDPHQLEEEQDEANEADHQPAADTTAAKVTVIQNKRTVVVQTKDTVAPSKNIFQKIMGIFKK